MSTLHDMTMVRTSPTHISQGVHALDLLYELEDGLSLLLCLANRYKSLTDDPAHPGRMLA